MTKGFINIKIPKFSFPTSIKTWMIFIFILGNIFQLLPEISSLVKWNESMDLTEVIQVQLNQQHFTKEEGEKIGRNTYTKYIFDGDSNSKIIVKVYPGNDIHIHTLSRDGDDYLYWVPSQSSLKAIQSNIPSVGSIFKRLFEISSAFAGRSQDLWNVPFKDRFIGWQQVNIIAIYHRYYINGQVWKYFYDIRRSKTFGFHRIK
tara:strand:+ start:612 stop:1220 length:609 start_codon:yes stop_codon:yes gene_type:complete